MKNVFIIVSGNRYPEGDAGAVREHAFALILKELGYTPIVVSMGPSTNFIMKTYDGVSYYSLRYKKQNIIFRVLGRFLYNKNLNKILKRIDKTEIKGIMYVSGGRKTSKFVRKFTLKNSINLYHDSVEWYSPEEFPDGEENKAYQANNRLNTEIVGKGWRTVAISSYLYEHFKDKCDKVIRIPVIMNVSSIEYNLKSSKLDEKLKFAYAGSPGTKDYLAEIISGFAMLSSENINKIELHIAGVTKEQLVSVCKAKVEDIDKLGDALVIYGRLPREKAVQKVREADFSLLLRDENLRYAKAGFPTKIVESLSCATPPMCNYSSDLSMYLFDGQNAFIVGGNKAKDVNETLVRILNFDRNLLPKIRENARKTAEENFDYTKYINVFREFIKET